MLPSPFSSEQIEIASHCSAAWNEMEGDDRVRFCRQCNKNVYNLSAMSPSEAATLVQEMEGAPCVCLYRRTDGTVLTDDCPVGIRQAKNAIQDLFTVIGFVVMMISGFVICRASGGHTDTISALRRTEPFAKVINWICPRPPAPPARHRRAKRIRHYLHNFHFTGARGTVTTTA
jgi:hypothetical protein